MKLKTVKKRFINSKKRNHACTVEGEKVGLAFWRDSLRILKRDFWRNGKFNSAPAYMVYYCGCTGGVKDRGC